MISPEWFEANAVWILSGVGLLQVLKLVAYGKNLRDQRRAHQIFQRKRQKLQEISDAKPLN